MNGLSSFEVKAFYSDRFLWPSDRLKLVREAFRVDLSEGEAADIRQFCNQRIAIINEVLKERGDA